jgi:hypothetical protein
MESLDVFSTRIGTMNLDRRAERRTLLPLPFRGERAGARGPSLLGTQARFVEGRFLESMNGRGFVLRLDRLVTERRARRRKRTIWMVSIGLPSG